MSTMHQSSEWNKRPEVIIGNAGERIIFDRLQDDDLVVCINASDHPAPFDGSVWRYNKKTGRTEPLYYYEVKVKSRLTRYNATGFDTRKLNTYMSVQKQTGVPFLVFFIDPVTYEVYGNKLDVLLSRFSTPMDKYRYPNTSLVKGKTVFSLLQMEQQSPLTAEEQEILESAKRERQRVVMAMTKAAS